MKTKKWGSNIPSNLPMCDIVCKYERVFYYLVFPQQQTLRDFQNSSPFGQRLILKLIATLVVYVVRLVASVQENPLCDSILLHEIILYMKKSSAG
jgi:hypothetical protein